MKGVIDQIKLETYGDAKWRLTEPFDWYGITVPEGFITDFASIPPPARVLINPVGKIRTAALVHDYLYSLQGRYVNPASALRVYSRAMVDEIFLDIMRLKRMSWWKRQAAYRLVRMFGWIFWNKLLKT